MSQQVGPNAGAAGPPAVVLDTNVVLDWLVFRDHRVAPLAGAISQGRLRWLATPRMRRELASVLGRDDLLAWKVDEARVLAAAEQYAQPCAEPPPCVLHCADRDDQVFIDLALAHSAHWLVTHDKALLRLARAARSHGTVVCRPEEWAWTADPAARP